MTDLTRRLSESEGAPKCDQDAIRDDGYERTLVVGASGLVGARLLTLLGGKGVGTYFERRRPALWQLDLTDDGNVRRALDAYRPSTVILSAALANVDECEALPWRSRAVNVKGVQRVAAWCRARDCALAFLSTDYVFNGEEGLYGEQDLPSPINVYGRHKAEAEQIVLDTVVRALVVRTCMVYGPRDGEPNPLLVLVRALRDGKVVRAAQDQYGCPTSVEDLARGVLELVNRRASGIYHLAGPKLASRYDYARMVAKTLELDSSVVVPVLGHELQRSAIRPKYCGLDIEKARRELDFDPVPPTVGLRELLEDPRFRPHSSAADDPDAPAP